MKTESLKKITEHLYEIPRTFRKGMLVPARIYGSEGLISDMDDAVLQQLTNVAMLPGIQKYALCMPDGHSGYGFPIGGVAAIDPGEGVISPGGIGFDINCGVRLVATNLCLKDVQGELNNIIDSLFNNIPCGVGGKGIVQMTPGKFDEAMVKGALWAVENGRGKEADLDFIEERGCIGNAAPACVSNRARERGKNQVGSLGSGNHYCEIQVVKDEHVYDRDAAAAFGIHGNDQIVVMIHTGSRGFGHQVASDYLERFLSAANKYGLSMPDRELACAPFDSRDGQDYYRAMNCAINIAFLNRQLIMHRLMEVFSDIMGKSPEDMGMRLVYDVCHNTAKLENHFIDGKEKQLLLHRKGATRAFASGMKGIPARYGGTGQPVFIGGSMQTGSYLLRGVDSCSDAFYTTAHGSGRVMSRSKAKKLFNGRELQKAMSDRGIYVKTASYSGLAEEAGKAYKDIDDVVQSTEQAGLGKVVARFEPLGNIKG